MFASPSISGASVNVQDRFVSLLPRIEQSVRAYFRDIRCAVRRADFIAEAVALAWRWFLRLTERGKDVAKFASAMASLAACGPAADVATRLVAMML